MKAKVVSLCIVNPGVIVRINYDDPASVMLLIKFHCNRPSGSGKEDFAGFLPYMGAEAILVM